MTPTQKRLIAEKVAQMIALGVEVQTLLNGGAEVIDPRNPENKLPDGKLSKQGEDVLFDMFERGVSVYSVARAMDISYGAAKWRKKQWEAQQRQAAA